MKLWSAVLLTPYLGYYSVLCLLSCLVYNVYTTTLFYAPGKVCNKNIKLVQCNNSTLLA
jgi:hypothetical protein